jgi:hypothetical protein
MKSIYRNKKLLRIVATFPCQLCGCQDKTAVPAHSNQLRDGKGRGLKAHDYRVATLCYQCHYDIDQNHRYKKEEKIAMFEEAHRKTIGLLFEGGYLSVK